MSLYLIALGPFSVILREDSAETQVDRAEDNRMGHNLGEVSCTRRERQEHARGEKNEKNHGDEDIRIKGSHL